MSDQWGGPGWWIGSDGKWHPPREPAVVRDKPFRPPGSADTPPGTQAGEGLQRRSAPVAPERQPPTVDSVRLDSSTADGAPLHVEFVDDNVETDDADVALGAIDLDVASDAEVASPSMIDLDEERTVDIVGQSQDAPEQWPVFDLRREVEANRELARQATVSDQHGLSESGPADGGDARLGLSYAAPLEERDAVDAEALVFDLRVPAETPTELDDHAPATEPEHSAPDNNVAIAPPTPYIQPLVDASKPSIEAAEVVTVEKNLFGPVRPATPGEPATSTTQNRQISSQAAEVSTENTRSQASFNHAGRVPLPVLDERVSYVDLSDDQFRRRTGPILLTLATLLALLSGLLGALWLRERSANDEAQAELAESVAAVETVDAGTGEDFDEGRLLDRIADLEAENNRLEQQLADMSALVLELPEGRVAQIGTDFAPAFADEQDGRLVAVDDSGNYAVWGNGVEGGITETGSLAGTPTALFISRNRAWIATNEAGIAVLTLANEAGPTFVDYGPASFLAEEERGYWTYNGERGEVARINKADGAVTNTVALPSDVVDLTIGAGSVWALGDDGLVYRINTADFTVQALDLGDTIIGVTAGPDALWVLSAGDGALRRVDPVTGEVLVSVPVGQDPVDALFSGNSVWVVLRAGASLIEVDTRTSAVVSRTGLSDVPTGLHQGEDGVFVTMSDDAQLIHVSSSLTAADQGNEDEATTEDQG